MNFLLDSHSEINASEDCHRNFSKKKFLNKIKIKPLKNIAGIVQILDV